MFELKNFCHALFLNALMVGFGFQGSEAASSKPIRSHCGTAHRMELANTALGTGVQAQEARQKIAASARTLKSAANGPYSRTWQTPHFTIYYSLLGIHQSKFLPQDSLLIEELLNAKNLFLGLTGDSRDSAIYKLLDSKNIPAPGYVQRAGEIFEMAFAFYTDTLGMPIPQGAGQSIHYRGPPSTGKRIVVDIADINNFQTGYKGEEYYGLTLQPPNLAIILENDFLWNATLLPSGEIKGDSISSQLNGTQIHNYVREFDLGLRLTIYHEFYHIMQFNYVPNHPHGFHAWYELSAVGMEERKVPEGNDYFQYLPCIFNTPEEVGLLSTGRAVCNPEAAYSNGIFHMYLSQVLGKSFDAPIWEALSKNGDYIDKALPEVLQTLGHPIGELYPDYAAKLLLSGQASRPDHFVSDMPSWPAMVGDSLNPDALAAAYKNKLRPFSFLPIRLPNDFVAGRVSAQFAGDSSATLVQITNDAVVTKRYAKSSAVLSPSKGDGHSWLLLYNLNPTQSASIQISTADIPFRVYPNPLSLSEHEALQFTLSNRLTFPLTLTLMNESGEIMSIQNANSPDEISDWNLKEPSGKAIEAGIFYWQINQEAWHPILITP